MTGLREEMTIVMRGKPAILLPSFPPAGWSMSAVPVPGTAGRGKYPGQDSLKMITNTAVLVH